MVESFIADRQPAALDQVFHALSDSTRRAILRDITPGEKTVGEIAGPYAMSLAAVSKHLDVLERASLIRRERQGACRLVRLNPKPLEAAQDWLAFYEQFWSDNLDRLQEFLERRTEPQPEPAKPAAHRQPKATHRQPKKEK